MSATTGGFTQVGFELSFGYSIRLLAVSLKPSPGSIGPVRNLFEIVYDYHIMTRYVSGGANVCVRQE